MRIKPEYKSQEVLLPEPTCLLLLWHETAMTGKTTKIAGAMEPCNNVPYSKYQFILKINPDYSSPYWNLLQHQLVGACVTHKRNLVTRFGLSRKPIALMRLPHISAYLTQTWACMPL
jgi:hypothetical protein